MSPGLYDPFCLIPVLKYQSALSVSSPSTDPTLLRYFYPAFTFLPRFPVTSSAVTFCPENPLSPAPCFPFFFSAFSCPLSSLPVRHIRSPALAALHSRSLRIYQQRKVYLKVVKETYRARNHVRTSALPAKLLRISELSFLCLSCSSVHNLVSLPCFFLSLKDTVSDNSQLKTAQTESPFFFPFS